MLIWPPVTELPIPLAVLLWPPLTRAYCAPLESRLNAAGQFQEAAFSRREVVTASADRCERSFGRG